MADVAPATILRQVAEAVPADCRENLVVIGSLAAGYHFFGDQPDLQVRTKDIDSVLVPHHRAAAAGKDIAERLLDSGWTHCQIGSHTVPGDPETADTDLPVVRLCPPGSTDWFIGLLSAPAPDQGRQRTFSRVALSTGHYALVSFRFLSVASFKPLKTPYGIYCARPEMMALANLLEHPAIGDETMSGRIGGRSIKRSNKDLGRVLALARLATPKVFEAHWLGPWREALAELYPEASAPFLARVGNGLIQLLSSGSDFEEAVHTCNHGLLSSRQATAAQLRATGQQLLTFVVEPLSGKSPAPAPPRAKPLRLRVKPTQFQLPGIGTVAVRVPDHRELPDEIETDSLAWLRATLQAWVSSETVDAPKLANAIAELDDGALLTGCRELAQFFDPRLSADADADQIINSLKMKAERWRREAERRERTLREPIPSLGSFGLKAMQDEFDRLLSAVNPIRSATEMFHSASAAQEILTFSRNLKHLPNVSALDHIRGNLLSAAGAEALRSELAKSTRFADSVLRATNVFDQKSAAQVLKSLNAVTDVSAAIAALDRNESISALVGITDMAQSAFDSLRLTMSSSVVESFTSGLLAESQTLAAIMQRSVASELIDQRRWYLDALGASLQDHFIEPLEDLLDNLPFGDVVETWEPNNERSGVVATIDARAWEPALSADAKERDVALAVDEASRYYRMLADLFGAYQTYHERISRRLDPGQIITPDGVRVLRQVTGLQGTAAVSENTFGVFATHLYVLIVETTTRANVKTRSGLPHLLRQYRNWLLCHNPDIQPDIGKRRTKAALIQSNRRLIDKEWPETAEDWRALQCAIVEAVINYLENEG